MTNQWDEYRVTVHGASFSPTLIWASSAADAAMKGLVRITAGGQGGLDLSLGEMKAELQQHGSRSGERR